MTGHGNEETLRTIRLSGTELHYLDVGTGAPVLLVHGNGESHAIFYGMIDRLAAAGYRVLAPDSRGQGANRPVSEYHYADMAGDMFELITALELVRPAYYGYSDGGIIGLMLAAAHPDLLSLMAVSGTNMRYGGVREEFIRECEDILKQRDDPLIRLMMTEPDIDPESLRDVKIPVLVTAGENDLILPEETERLCRALPNAEKRIIPGADHGSYVMGSDVMAGLLIDFLKRNGK